MADEATQPEAGRFLKTDSAPRALEEREVAAILWAAGIHVLELAAKATAMRMGRERALTHGMPDQPKTSSSAPPCKIQAVVPTSKTPRTIHLRMASQTTAVTSPQEAHPLTYGLRTTKKLWMGSRTLVR